MVVLVSGAVSIIVINYNNMKFILFGDRHGSYEGMCNSLCETNICYTVDKVIHEIIDNANNNGEYVDVYLESPVIDPSYHDTSSRILLDNNILKGPLKDTIKKYHDCLYTNKCGYNNARFHYIDIRGKLNEASVLLPIKQIKLALENYINDDIVEKILSYDEDSIKIHITFFILEFIISFFFNSDNFIESNLWKYLMLCIESDDFINDFNKTFEKLLIVPTENIESTINLLSDLYYIDITDNVNIAAQNAIKYVYKWCLDSLVIKEKDGKIMHLLRSQLYGLESQGDIDRAQSIKNYFITNLSSIDISPVKIIFDNFNNGRILYLQEYSIVPELFRIYIDNIRIILPSIELELVDMYTLSRMFRTYPPEFRSKYKSLEHHVQPTYIIEYAGLAHIKNISDYLVSLGGDIKIYKPEVGHRRCIVSYLL